MTKAKRSPSRIEYPFVLDALADVETHVRCFFGSTAIYRHEKILLILHERDEHPHDSGVWVATEVEHHASLRADFPSLRSISIFGPGETTWQNIPAEDPRFERDVIAVCEAIVSGDSRIGRVPAARRPRKQAARKSGSRKR